MTTATRRWEGDEGREGGVITKIEKGTVSRSGDVDEERKRIVLEDNRKRGETRQIKDEER